MLGYLRSIGAGAVFRGVAARTAGCAVQLAQRTVEPREALAGVRKLKITDLKQTRSASNLSKTPL